LINNALSAQQQLFIQLKMNVFFIVDSFGLNEEQALQVIDPKKVASVRTRIYQHLLNPTPAPLKIHVSHALFRRFKSFEGMQGVHVRYLYPTTQMFKLLGETPPPWLSNELIMALGLLNQPPLPDHLRDSEESAGKILGLIHPDLLDPPKMSIFYNALRESIPNFTKLLRLEVMQSRLIQGLQRVLSLDCIQGLMLLLIHTDSVTNTLDALACEQIRETMRDVVQIHLPLTDFPDPARQFDQELLACLPPIAIAEQQADDLPNQLIQLLDILDRQVRANACSKEVFAQLMIVSWPRVLGHMRSLLNKNPKLASQALADALYALKEGKALAKTVEKMLIIATPCEPLSESATVKEALLWSSQYIDYARREFLSQQEPCEKLSLSFSHWLMNQQARIMRSNADWRQVSAVTEQHLSANRLVILCMVDALGTLNTDIICAELKQLEQISIDEQMLFSPLPTLTEVGKMAVITGKSVTALPSHTETALQQHYAHHLVTPSALKIAKSWRAFQTLLEKETQLLIYFENRIDERLHGCTSFEKHREEIKSIAKQLACQIKEWMIDAAQLHREIVVLITADHGITSISQRDTLNSDLGYIGERTVKVKHKPDKIPEQFAFLPAEAVKEGASGYLVQKGRVRNGGKTPLTHGGLLPEEVLIPLITIRKSPISHTHISKINFENSAK